MSYGHVANVTTVTAVTIVMCDLTFANIAAVLGLLLAVARSTSSSRFLHIGKVRAVANIVGADHVEAGVQRITASAKVKGGTELAQIATTVHVTAATSVAELAKVPAMTGTLLLQEGGGWG